MSESPWKHTSLNYPRWLGGSASCMAVVVSHHFDLNKVRMQATKDGARHGFLRIGCDIVKEEGIKVTYGTIRIALYEELKKFGDDKPTGTPMLAAMAALSGFCGALVGTPSDIANIRMQNDRSQPPMQRHNYRDVFDAWLQMKRTEGWAVFTEGLQFASYDLFKVALQVILGDKSERTATHLSASLLDSLVATTLVRPMDVIRTQMMSASQRASLWVTLRGLIQADELRWHCHGWPEDILVFLEQHRKVYQSWKMYEAVGI
ncbi:mitochondrial carrier domain-containing protein [Aspergillus californicus]